MIRSRPQSTNITSSMAAIKQHKRILTILYVLYLCLLFYFLFFSEGFGRAGVSAEYRYNLQLFREIMRFYRYRYILGNKAFFINVFGNVIAFMPMGFFQPILCDKKLRGGLVVLNCFVVSLVVETIQLIFKIGCFDVDDLFLNTLGGLFGVLLYFVFQKCMKREG